MSTYQEKYLPLPMVYRGTTSNDESFRNLPNGVFELPVEGHCGAFGAKRTYDTHTGVDLYAPIGTVVTSIEEGIIIRIEMFTGVNANSDWWNETMAVHVLGESGVFVYGELALQTHMIEVGEHLYAGDDIGEVARVLKVDKGRPTSMLHLELWSKNYNGSAIWRPDKFNDPMLYDPTPLLIEIGKDWITP